MSRIGTGLKEFIKRVSHEVPTGPHTDVRRGKINPSFKKRLTGVGPPPKSPRGTGTKGGFGALGF